MEFTESICKRLKSRIMYNEQCMIYLDGPSYEACNCTIIDGLTESNRNMIHPYNDLATF